MLDHHIFRGPVKIYRVPTPGFGKYSSEKMFSLLFFSLKKVSSLTLFFSEKKVIASVFIVENDLRPLFAPPLRKKIQNRPKVSVPFFFSKEVILSMSSMVPARLPLVKEGERGRRYKILGFRKPFAGRVKLTQGANNSKKSDKDLNLVRFF